jgi:hypothetical protein
MRGRSLAGPVTSQLAAQPRPHFAHIERGDLTAYGFRGTFRDWCADATNYPREVAGTYSAISHDGVHDWSRPDRCIDQSLVRTRLRYNLRLVCDRQSRIHPGYLVRLGQLSKYFVPIATACVV